MSAPAITAPVHPARSAAPARIGPAKAARHGFALAGRGVIKSIKQPVQLLDAILTPALFLVMFVYLFGGAIAAGDTDAYVQTIVPGIMVMTIFQASIGIGVALSTDASTGVFDRFRSMPIARSAPLVGAVLADFVRYAVSLTVVFGLALLMGYRIEAGVAALPAAIALLIAFGMSFSWVSVFIGMQIKSPGAVAGVMTVVILPLTFASNVAVPSETMPGWLEAWSDVNPVSLLSDAMRGLLNGGEVAGPLAGSLVWMAAVIVVFFPLAMRAYRKSAA